MRCDGHALDAVDELVESCVANLDAAFQETDASLLFLMKALGDAVIFGEIEINDLDLAGPPR